MKQSKSRQRYLTLRGKPLEEAERRMEKSIEPNDLSYWINTYLTKLWGLKE